MADAPALPPFGLQPAPTGKLQAAHNNGHLIISGDDLLIPASREKSQIGERRHLRSKNPRQRKSDPTLTSLIPIPLLYSNLPTSVQFGEGIHRATGTQRHTLLQDTNPGKINPVLLQHTYHPSILLLLRKDSYSSTTPHTHRPCPTTNSTESGSQTAGLNRMSASLAPSPWEASMLTVRGTIERWPAPSPLLSMTSSRSTTAWQI